MTTFFVRQSGGNDTNDGLSFANGWATIQFAADTAVAGDIVLIASDGTHTPTASVDIDTNAGTAAAGPVTFRGAGSAGEDDGTVATISGSSLPATTDLFTFVIDYTKWENLRFTAATRHNLFDNNTSIGNVFVNCRFDNAAEEGCSYLAVGFAQFFNCEFDNNGGNGCGTDDLSSNRAGQIRAFNCSFHDNGENGIQSSDGGLILLHCLFYDNTNHGLLINRDLESSGGSIIGNCVFNGNTSGILMSGSLIGIFFGSVYNCVFSNNSSHGVNFGSAHIDGHVDYNLYYLNTTAHRANFPTGANDIEDDNPDFTSITDGSEDFTPATGSPLLDAATPLKTA